MSVRTWHVLIVAVGVWFVSLVPALVVGMLLTDPADLGYVAGGWILWAFAGWALLGFVVDSPGPPSVPQSGENET